MKKSILVLATLFTAAGAKVYAQQGPVKLNVGISGGVSNTQTFNSALGVDGGIAFRLNKTFSATADIGFEHMFEKSVYGLGKYTYPYGSNYNSFPIQAGLKATLPNGFYIAGKAGIALNDGRKSYPNSFIFTPSIGLALKNGLDFSLRYENRTRIMGSQNIGLRVGYTLPFKSK